MVTLCVTIVIQFVKTRGAGAYIAFMVSRS